ncbi:bifunctional methylenetetrahydrofolate dehydrogenase/methenyltetrahydrofolate cyclohydrolase FolD [Terribacillus saccharophilus]|uniref:Bifunctional protein FolD n=1 Tax=Terribacillus saccharophilus TaxID=361277 RepID=A0A075LKT5_9BACI|nr:MULTISPECIES: bifunctional methylenetetrahydrofolate dehydrogenase/methenyltetrahydrofolate cyclohydrolase FolD [Terribacillus]AIF66756.1 5,10-methylene-tetrahydrofolate cyclohydrolase [Terribacillus goriensis]MCM3224534.1 bifunctional methylenetetrahydrofolate dehydrogenase/methenyltetrahydrofolate cyclohydrolase FolD [Terribacillus saccharophilus]MEC0283570.1 bifunctional methylenetetrahydrofolate dehydrogenase/methenyltetrahydrofolate cyclohydrolase FolD [Terribacillus saccharophilus]MEC0
MTAELIYGKELAATIREELKQEAAALKEQDILPHLTVVIVGDDPASKSYVKGKEKASAEIGISSDLIELPSATTQTELLDLIQRLNLDVNVNGILVQLPLPAHIDEQAVIDSIDPEKDVDGFHPANVGKMMLGEDTYYPCTPYGIIQMLKSKDVEIAGKTAVIVGRSNIVGKPIGQLLLNEHATVIHTHSRTPDLRSFTKQADILVVAVGREHMIKAEDIKEGAIVIDVGVNRNAAGKLTGDVDFEHAKEVASIITPVPGGVGPMTITMLMLNTIKAARRQAAAVV